MDSPVPTLVITMMYFLAVFLGRRIMAKRKAFSLKWVLVPYNLSMCALNMYIGYEVSVTHSPAWFPVII